MPGKSNLHPFVRYTIILYVINTTKVISEISVPTQNDTGRNKLNNKNHAWGVKYEIVNKYHSNRSAKMFGNLDRTGQMVM